MMDRGWLSQQAHKFSPRDSFHPSKEGHIDAARIVNEIVDRVGVPKHPRVNDFESFDNCANWLVDEDQAKGVTYSPNGYIHTIPTKQKKHALSFKGGKGSIMLTNPFNDWKYLTISYMTTGPAPSKYPEVELAISPPLNTTTILDPNTELPYVRPVHLPREYFVGKVPPGDITLSFSTLTRSIEPFRIVSYTMSSTKPVMSIV